MAETRIGFVGLGIMGAPMARNLLRAGHELIVHNRSPAKAQALADEGATVVGSPREVAQRSDVVITMLPDSPDVEAVYFGQDGVIASARADQLLIDMSSIDPAVARRVAERANALGAQVLDAPVSGGDVGAIEGTLSIMVGGPQHAYERALPIFRHLGRTIVHVGDSGAGQVTKACNQVLVALTIEAVSEALVLGSKAGVDPRRLIEVFSGGLAANRVMEVRRRNFLEHDFTPGFRVRLHRKDLRIALELADELGIELPATISAERLMQELVAVGRSEEDHSALLTMIEDRADHRIGPIGQGLTA